MIKIPKRWYRSYRIQGEILETNQTISERSRQKKVAVFLSHFSWHLKLYIPGLFFFFPGVLQLLLLHRKLYNTHKQLSRLGEKKAARKAVKTFKCERKRGIWIINSRNNCMQLKHILDILTHTHATNMLQQAAGTMAYSLTNPSKILEPKKRKISEFNVAEERHATDFKAPKLSKGSSGPQVAGAVVGTWYWAGFSDFQLVASCHSMHTLLLLQLPPLPPLPSQFPLEQQQTESAFIPGR